MNTDASVTGGTNGNQMADPIYDNFDQTPLMDAKDTEDALPRGIYVVKFDGGKGAFTKDENLPQIRLSATVVEGQGETAGRKIFGALKYAVSKFEYKDNGQGVKVRQPITDNAKWTESCDELKQVLMRVATILNLLQKLPSRPHTAETLTAFGAQFAGKTAVIEVGQLPGQGDYGPSNFFVWGSIRALDEIVTDKKKNVVLGPAIEYARKKIAAANLKAAQKAGKATNAAAAATAPTANPSDFS